MVFLLFILFVIAVAWFIYTIMQCKPSLSASNSKSTGNNNASLKEDAKSSSFAPKLNLGTNAPIQELKYFCIKDKGYHISVWPKDLKIGDYMEFNLAGLSFRDNIDDYLGEFKGTLEAEPTNAYDANAIKVLAPDGHHVGYVPKDQTQYVRDFTSLPCSCFCYIGDNCGIYFSDCYIVRKQPNVSPIN